MNRLLVSFAVVVFLVGCTSSADDGNVAGNWSDITSAAKGSLVRFYMDSGQADLDLWIDTVVAEEVKKRFGVTLVRVPLNADVVVAKLVAEKGRGLRIGDVDLFLVNGDAFRVAREAGVLFGPFAEKLPNYVRYVDKESAAFDGDYPVEGYEVPLGNTHFMAVPQSSASKAGALVVSNFLLSPEVIGSRF